MSVELGQQFRGHRGDWNLVADKGLDVGQANGIFLAAETDRIAVGAGPRRAADAVHVIGSILRQVEIEDVTDIRDV